MNSETHASSNMANAIEELQVKVAYQEHTIDTLNDEVTRQSIQIEQLTLQLSQLNERVQGLQASNIAKQSEEAPPPHY